MTRFNANLIAAHAMLMIVSVILALAFHNIDAGLMPYIALIPLPISLFEIRRLSQKV